jgi:hypothetical protein
MNEDIEDGSKGTEIHLELTPGHLLETPFHFPPVRPHEAPPLKAG